jgi:hypothetical protein
LSVCPTYRFSPPTICSRFGARLLPCNQPRCLPCGHHLNAQDRLKTQFVIQPAPQDAVRDSTSTSGFPGNPIRTQDDCRRENDHAGKNGKKLRHRIGFSNDGVTARRIRCGRHLARNNPHSNRGEFPIFWHSGQGSQAES